MAQQGAATGLSFAGQVVFGSLSAGTFGLGVWQTQRYFEKQNLVVERQSALQMPPLTKFSFDGQPFRRMQLQGTYLYDKECLVGPRGPPLGALPNKPGYASGGMARAPLGYFVLTPLVLAGGDGSGTNKTTDKDGNKDQFVVWVNRGWVPQFMVEGDDDDENSNARSARRRNATPENEPPARQPVKRQRQIIAWERPNENNRNLSEVTVVSSNPETPRFLVAGHKFHVHPPRLFWFDFETLRSTIMGGSEDPQVLSLVTEVRDTQEATTTKDKFVFPLTPPALNVGDFKTSPMVHAGYAATWYGLAMAGFFMTRKMILKH